MGRLIVLTTPELEPGYRLAGVATQPLASPGEATERRRFARRPSCRIFSIRSRRNAVEAPTSRLLAGFGM